MKKAGIITLNGYFNYGNRLQNFALQEALKSLDFEVETIRLERFPKKFNFYNLGINIYSKIRGLAATGETRLERNRRKIFYDFSLKYINETKNEYSAFDDLSNLNDLFDKFIIGSDQVWNPKMNGFSPAFFADFADQNKKISYAASFGVASLEEDIKTTYTSLLNEIPFISVRENEGAEIVKDLTNKDATVLVDPTMLLTREEWLEIAKKAPTENKYLLTYFLGGIPDDYRPTIEKYAKEHKLDIINLGDINDSVAYETGPAEFIDYINNCELFCTDSFHGIVFSIILQKPFIAFKRVGKESMYSRISTLLDTFDLTNREIEKIDFKSNIIDIDFSQTNKIIEQKRSEAFQFLNESLN